MGMQPTDAQIDEIIDLAISLSADSSEVAQYIEKMQQGPTKEERDAIAKAEAERKAKEAAERKAEAERKAKEEAERKAKEEAKRKAEAERKAKEEAERKAKAEAEAERKAKVEAERKDNRKEKITIWIAVIGAIAIILGGGAMDISAWIVCAIMAFFVLGTILVALKDYL